MAILLHPTRTRRKYHDGDGESAYGWTTCVRDELARRFPDLPIALPENGPSPEDLRNAKVLLAGRVPAELLERMPDLQWIQFPGPGADWIRSGRRPFRRKASSGTCRTC